MNHCQVRKIAPLAHLEAQILRDPVQREEVDVYFNLETTPVA